MNEKPLGHNWMAIEVVGSRVPLAWIHRKTGEWINNPEYIERALPPEPPQYEQALIAYELCEKVKTHE